MNTIQYVSAVEERVEEVSRPSTKRTLPCDFPLSWILSGLGVYGGWQYGSLQPPRQLVLVGGGG